MGTGGWTSGGSIAISSRRRPFLAARRCGFLRMHALIRKTRSDTPGWDREKPARPDTLRDRDYGLDLNRFAPEHSPVKFLPCLIGCLRQRRAVGEDALTTPPHRSLKAWHPCPRITSDSWDEVEILRQWSPDGHLEEAG